MGLLWQQEKQQASGKSKAMRWHLLFREYTLLLTNVQ